MSDVLTPMMQQYHRLKREVPPDALLLFRLGDFYEMFFGDAEIGARLLDLTLTQRQGTPMCGMPYHAAEGYIAQLLKAGRRVAICDQMEAPKPGQVVRREVTQILSPGSVLDAGQLEPKRNNFLASVAPVASGFGVAALDLTTGEFFAGDFSTPEALRDALGRLNPAEVVVAQGQRIDLETSALSSGERLGYLLVEHDAWSFSADAAEHTLRDHFKTASLDGFGLAGATEGKEERGALCAAGGLLHYLGHELRRSLGHIHSLRIWQREDILALDAATRRNLELIEPLRAGAGQTTLLSAVDRTMTAGGGRLLRQWLVAPLRNLAEIRSRQTIVAWARVEQQERGVLQERLRQVRDVERLVARLAQGSGNARDLIALRVSLEQLPTLRGALEKHAVPALRALGEKITPLPELADLYARALAEDPPIVLKEGGLIRAGYNAALDELRAASVEGQGWLADLQRREQERTGIKSLKVRYNQVFGYYIEVSAANLGAVPSNYTRKQTLANAERFVTSELKDMEAKILGAQERSRQLEYELFLDLRVAAMPHLRTIQETARALHEIDVLLGWGALAQERDYVAPEVNEGGLLLFEEARHPVLEQLPASEKFVPNDTRLDTETERLIILTGPNMAGKSTYIRQVAVLALLAHCGCFVPARRAVVGLLDRIFTRVGASDDLGRGQSTFMVEMNETANILNHATGRSLVILDEIGRGTSTFDGLSIAWSVAEYLNITLRTRTLFATHYHELTELARLLPATKNYNVAVREWGEQIVFLRKIVPGGADKSYGIQVARLAGLPAPVLKRAKEILRELEEEQLDNAGQPRLAKAKQKKERAREVLRELDLFDRPAEA
ncbi:MAG TPA: DNA mismatch repair protein MutS [Candidatus Methylacidiphilales bacterium]|nr:DNA mismatch repair protein MutS [Candidatus Methylacidiphilales bacterium]